MDTCSDSNPLDSVFSLVASDSNCNQVDVIDYEGEMGVTSLDACAMAVFNDPTLCPGGVILMADDHPEWSCRCCDSAEPTEQMIDWSFYQVQILPVCECHSTYDWTSFGEECNTHCMETDMLYCHPGHGDSNEPCGRHECHGQVRCRKPAPTPEPFCGDGICQDGEVESFCMVDCTDELADNLCSCVGELDLCDETCSALTTSQGASSECQLMYSLAFCGQLIDDQTSYRDFCGAPTCPSTLVVDTTFPTSMEPTNMPTPPPTFSCSFEQKNDECWSIAQITKQDCSEIKQWWKQIGRFLDVHGIRNYGIDSYGVDIGGDFNKLADVKNSFLDYCSNGL